jgi:hypothetical protein
MQARERTRDTARDYANGLGATSFDNDFLHQYKPKTPTFPVRLRTVGEW